VVCVQCGARIRLDECAKCGRPLRPGARFCGEGHPVEAGPGGDVPCSACGKFHEGKCNAALEAPDKPGAPSPGIAPTQPDDGFWSEDTVISCKGIFDTLLGWADLPATDDDDMEEIAPYVAALLRKHANEFGPYDVEIKAGFFVGKLVLGKIALKKELAEAKSDLKGSRDEVAELRRQNAELKATNDRLSSQLEGMAARLEKMERALMAPVEKQPETAAMTVDQLTAPTVGATVDQPAGGAE
jgi:hypothetical protein